MVNVHRSLVIVIAHRCALCVGCASEPGGVLVIADT
jgi:hypothetical protein